MQDIHDIRGPVPFGLDPALIYIALVMLAILLLAAILVWGYRKWKGKQKNDTGLEQLPLQPVPYEAAMNALDLLEKSDDNLRMFYFDLTLVLRKYMGDSFGTHAAEMTSQEFVFFIRKAALDEGIKQAMIEFSRSCDPYKYAGAMPESEQVKDDIVSVRKMITQVEVGLKQETDGEQGV